MTLTRTCCCGKCYFGARSTDANATACLHNKTEVLELRIPRPSYAYGVGVISYSDCDCAGEYQTRTQCPASDTIEVDYDHFHPEDRTYTWFYEKPSDGNIWPPCTSPCCGYDDASPGFNDAECCDSGLQCSTTYRQYTGLAASRLQQQIIEDGSVPHLGNDSDAEDCEYGDAYWFLQDVANHDTAHRYRHWIVVSGAVTETSTQNLEQTMLCVVHKEKWWERGYNSLNQDDNPSASDSDDAESNCRTPKYWVFACSGVPLYSWEIKQLSSLTTQQQDDVIIAIHNGDPIPENLADILEQDGILVAKDHERVDGKIIEKTLRYLNNDAGGADTTETAYFYARPGGWTYVCQKFSANPAVDLAAKFPQLPRRFSVGGVDWQTGAIECDQGSEDNCFTASPLPGNDCECAFTGGPGGGCDPCAGLIGCAPGVLSACGGTSDIYCMEDVIVGNCKGVWAQFSHYYKNLATDSNEYECGVSNDGYICRVMPGGTCDFGSLPDEIGHEIPTEVSESVRNGDTANGALCCGGEGTYERGTAQCPALTPDAADCDDPTNWGPNV